ncbi:MAG: MBL fold metallo-hydrolase [Candidatus Lokiarchaeota archaeon]|nr:MBL fold metallo-hydrolase [Candidatus Lokiarchaeota archaeon]
MPMGIPRLLSIYIIENNGMRLMVDVGETLKVRMVIKKLKDFGLYPIHKIVLTHSHWDHAQGLSKINKLMKDLDVEILASENAIDNLRHPEKMIDGFDGLNINPFEGEVTPLKEGDIIDLNGLELETMNFFGHTMDSIALFDKSNSNIFIGDAVSMRLDQDVFYIPLMPPDFHEKDLLKSFNKLRNMKDRLSSISLAHFGVWKDDDFFGTLNKMEAFHFDTKESIIKWYDENPSLKYITLKYHEKFTPDSKVHTKDNIRGLELLIEWLIEGLKATGDIK